jgi:hypothetical protein
LCAAGAIALWTIAYQAALPFLQDVVYTHCQTVDFGALHRIDLAFGVTALLAVTGVVCGFLALWQRARSSTTLQVVRLAAALLTVGSLIVLMVDTTSALYLFSAHVSSCIG